MNFIAYGWVARLTGNVVVVGSSPINGSRCFLEQETLPLLISTGSFQKQIRAWFHNRTKINWGPYHTLTNRRVIWADIKVSHNNSITYSMQVHVYVNPIWSVLRCYNKQTTVQGHCVSRTLHCDIVALTISTTVVLTHFSLSLFRFIYFPLRRQYYVTTNVSIRCTI